MGLVDKGRNPMCVYQSRLILSPFTQTIGVGLDADISELTRTRTQNSLLLRMDLETATSVNRYLNPTAIPLSDAAVARSGRCPNNDWVPFLGS